MIAAGAMVSQDVPPFCLVAGNHARPNGLNLTGLRRASIGNIADIKKMYHILYQENLTAEDAVTRIVESVPESKERDLFVAFVKSSQRGVCR